MQYAAVDYAGFVKAADAGRVSPVTLLHGPEPFLLDDALARLTRALFPGQTELSLGPRGPRRARGGRGGHRAVGPARCRGSATAGSWSRAASRRSAAKPAEPLAAYAKAPNPSTALVLVADAAARRRRTGCCRRCPPRRCVAAPALDRPRARRLAPRPRARPMGYELERGGGAACSWSSSGDDLTQLVGEVEKAALAGGPENRRVGAAEVRAVVGEHRCATCST